eukprot:TRINITY_DN1320_c0_g1_i2.p2 TRINITY_DN1320_c0_g1~~TRINITY_DN1320_c0_g1_i2.p2  ORF type:complete len:159 (-),score=58.88 TRINITY_DN1320_c0_g1_i2:180-656(-)
MIQLELPHINVLSKIDLVNKYGKLAFNLDFFTEVNGLEFLLPFLDQDPFMQKFKSLNSGLCELVEDYALVTFQTLDINSKDSVYELIKVVDKSNGFVATSNNQKVNLNDPRLWSSDVDQEWDQAEYLAQEQEKTETLAAFDDILGDEDQYDFDFSNES